MPEQTVNCDILICGGGMAGLSLLVRAFKAGLWKDQQIIVLDRSQKRENDKTWSFWKAQDSAFEELISHSWKDMVFFSHAGKKIVLDNGDYTYNSIRSIDFYTYAHRYLKQFPNLCFVRAEITHIRSAGGRCFLETPAAVYESRYLYNSVCNSFPEKKGEIRLLQHFKGWRIRTKAALPDPPAAWLMDFRTEQKHGTTFFYTLPVSANEVFIEYTLFSAALLAEEEYDEQIRLYLAQVLHISEYTLEEQEYGVIPMTDHRFARFEGNIIHIGTAGGDTRGSTGYTFTHTQQTIGRILQSVLTSGHPFFKKEPIGWKHQLYDAALLRVLAERSYPGHEIFTDLFSQVPARMLFAFLDAESSFREDTQIMSALRVKPFLLAMAEAVAARIS